MIQITPQMKRRTVSQATMALLGVSLLFALGCKEDKSSDDLKVEVQQLKFAVDSKDELLAEKNREILRFKRDMNERDRVNIDLRGELVKLRQQMTALPQSSRQIVELENENERLKTQVKILKDSIEELKNNVVIANGGTTDERVLSLSSQLQTVRAELVAKQQGVDELSRLVKQYELVLKEYKSENQQLATRLHQALTNGSSSATQLSQGSGSPVHGHHGQPVHGTHKERLAENIPEGNDLPGPKSYHARDYVQAFRDSKLPGQHTVTWEQNFNVHFNDGEWLFHKKPDNQYEIEFRGKVDEHFIKHFPYKNIEVPVGTSVVFRWDCDPAKRTVSLEHIYIGKAKVTGKLGRLYSALAKIY